MSALLVCAGSLNIDLIAAVPALPGHDGRVTAAPFERRLGGMAGNAAGAAARLQADWPLQVVLVAPLGTDSDSRWAEEELTARGIDTAWLDRHSLPSTPRCVILVEPDGSRAIVTEPTQLDYACLDACLAAYAAHPEPRLLYSEGHHLPWAGESVRRAYQQGWRLAVDIDGWPLSALNPAVLAELAGLCACVFLNRDYAEHLYADPIPALSALAQRTGTLFLLTLGADGAVVIAPDQAAVAVPARRVQVVDSTGAGDVFAGVFLNAWLHGLEPVAATRYATLAATLSTTAAGALGYPFTGAELTALAQKKPEQEMFGSTLLER